MSGFPADTLQKTFNLLQKNKPGRIKELHNIPDDLPDSFYALLEDMLIYKFKSRKSAKELLDHEFCTLHKSKDDMPHALQHAKSLKHVVRRHTIYLDYMKFERSITTLLVTMLNEHDIDLLLKKLEDPSEKNAEAHLDIVTIETLVQALQDLRKIFM